MDGLLDFFMHGNILLKIVFFQFAIAIVVLFFMKKFLNRELILSALERFYAAADEKNADINLIEVVFSAQCSAADEAQVRAIARERFPAAQVVVKVEPSLWGGVVIRIADKVIDSSLITKIKQFFKITGV